MTRLLLIAIGCGFIGLDLGSGLVAIALWVVIAGALDAGARGPRP